MSHREIRPRHELQPELKLPRIQGPRVILPKPEYREPKLDHGGLRFQKAVCYVCSTVVEKGFLIIDKKAFDQRGVLPSLIAKFTGDGYILIMNDDDIICENCYSLIVYAETLQRESQRVTKTLKDYILKKTVPKPRAHEQKSKKQFLQFSRATVSKKKMQGQDDVTGTPGSRIFNCIVCSATFNTRSAMKRHVKEHLTTWTCHFCDSEFRDQAEFVEHTRSHLGEGRPTAESLPAAVGGDRTFPCSSCNEVYNNEEDLAFHIGTHGEELINMDIPVGMELIDGQQNENAEFMDIFPNEAAHEETFVCKICAAPFQNVEDLTHHFTSNHEQPQVTDTYEEMEQQWQQEQTENTTDEVLEGCESIGEAEVLEDGEAGVLEEGESNGEVEELEEDDIRLESENMTAEVEGLEEYEYFSCETCGAVGDSQEILDEHVLTCGQEANEVTESDGVPCNEEVVDIFSPTQARHEEWECKDLRSEDVQSTSSSVKASRNVCLGCAETFSSRAKMQEHEEAYPEHAIVGCPDCQEKFSRERALNEHREKMHSDVSQMSCRFCPKAYSNLKQIKAHEARHARALRCAFKCEECGKIFQTHSGLRKHTAEHTGIYKFACEFCAKGFVARAPYEEHRATHTKEKRYSCEICERTFTHQATYWLHRKWHDNPLPYKCEECGLFFKHSSLLSVHRRRKHTGERPYACTYCDERFNVTSSLKRHLSLHTGIYPHNCETCQIGYSAKHKMALHMSKVHQDDTMLEAQRRNKNRELVMALKPTNEEQVPF